ncbi:MAG: zinc-ribbon domain-containing protein [Sediminimonas sp.]|uniref:zinc-ribbon domain-containing protein n=1 Tax=Sediminimonas sp. TaxID=2823379 RepID=UPI0028700FC9|nr:zinc-ribbon domain-containing protein [Sediminimonas sp.]MDR9483801.1 zinc-ribbon domain-containing protein [Sediminimonas sp.]
MRLICPNCGAQYEVSDDVIPRTGRDVQCSNCGNTWFQVHPDHDVGLAEELDQPLPEDQPPAHDTAQHPEDTSQEEKTDTPAQRRLDPSVADILREEAEHEAQAREAERASAGIESQPDLGLSDPDTNEAARRAREARERMARMQGMDTEPQTVEAESTSSSRRGLLPDIDEINSSLRSTSDRRPSEADDYDTPGNIPAPRPEAAANGSGFRIGFSIAVLIAIGFLALYAYADQVAAQFPQASGPLAQYVDAVTQARLWLDTQAQTVLNWLQQTADDVL